MSGTRERILRTLSARSRCTINELAEAIGISPISVRHHINSLQAEGLVRFEEERHGVGRPRQVYFLTEAGVEQFPTRYVRLTTRLLEQLKETMPETLVGELFARIAADLAKEMAADAAIQDLPMPQRLDLARKILQREGFDIEWEQHGDEFHIRETSCPYYFIGQNHPEVCAMDQVLLSSVLSVPAAKIQCILNGDAHCTYVVPNPNPAEKTA